MRFSDAALGVIFLVAGISLALYSCTLPSIPGHNYGAATFPLLISVGIFGCSARLLYTGTRQDGEPLVYLATDVKSVRAVLGATATVLLILFYIYFAGHLGFIVTASIITFTMFLILKVPAIKASILSVIAAFACDFIFRTMLLVSLPIGIMPRLPW